MTDTLPLILLLLAAAVVVVVIFRMLGLPPILGYLLVGAVLGPHARAGCRIPSRRATSPSSAWCS
jgi:Kef-type K+ transport system membrane component KefB